MYKFTQFPNEMTFFDLPVIFRFNRFCFGLCAVCLIYIRDLGIPRGILVGLRACGAKPTYNGCQTGVMSQNGLMPRVSV
jgi:hypothetical protein